MISNGFLRVASATLNTRIGKPIENAKEILSTLNKAEKASVIVFPELCITGYTVGDLLFTNALMEDVHASIDLILEKNKYPGLVIVGLPVDIDGVLFNCALVIQKNKMLGVVPKMYLPNSNEFYEKRWFRQGVHVCDKHKFINYNGQNVPFGHLIFKNRKHEIKLGIEICEDMWAPISPSIIQSMNGCNVICNLSASNETVNKDITREQVVNDLSRRNVCAYIYSSSNASESSSETVFSGNNIIAVDNSVLVNTLNFNSESTVTFADIDIPRLNFSRRSASSFRDLIHTDSTEFQIVLFDIEEGEMSYETNTRRTPFIPIENKEEFAFKATNIQTKGLERRLLHTKMQKAVIGVSGGLDSTLALLITCKAFDNLGISRKNIIGITMPGLATSKRTKSNAHLLMEKLGVTVREININEHVNNHFDVIGHDGKTQDIAYENTQARIRTLVLFNVSNMERALVIGTGDMSEIALGWCTYVGDQMSGYNVNSGVPKTLVRFLVDYLKDDTTKELLEDIINTPVSPELKDNQETEDTIGSYEINDFILHRLVECGDRISRIKILVKDIFNEDEKIVDDFFRRFKGAQFKRNTMPDGPKVLSFSLSQSNYRLPSDIDNN